MSGAVAESIALALLLGTLAFAVLRPFGWSEALAAVPAAAIVVGLGIVTPHEAGATLRSIGPTVGFLAAILLFGHLCDEAGVFAHLGARAADAAAGSARRLLLLVVALAALVTVTLTLDATVVLLTPVVLATARRLRVPARPFLYACARVGNSGSLLLPVSNLTNLLAFGATGLSFGRFAALMTLPWLVVCLGEWLALRGFFRADLAQAAVVAPAPTTAPRYALGVLIATVVLLVAGTSLGIAPAWAALLGCIALLVPRLRERRVPSLPRLVAAAGPGFCLFVLALSVIVVGVTRHGLGDALGHLVPDGSSWVALVAVAGLAAGLANIVNNLPATLALLPLVTGQPAAALAVLLGVNIGPNLAYPGSLATLLWRRQLPPEERPRAREFHLLGALTVPVLLVSATTALWFGVRVYP